MAKHNCDASLCVICVHLQAGDDWWGVPDDGESCDWMCGDCLDRYTNGDLVPADPSDFMFVCAECVRSVQANSRLHHPVEHDDGSWSY